GRELGPLAGVPFAVKNLFDVAGLPTLAGSKINRDCAPAARDATLIARLETAGAVLVGALNMGEYAYDFTGENVHYGPSRNPHDVKRMTGGSSGGSGAAVAGGYCRAGPFAQAQTALARVATALGVTSEIEIAEAKRARAAAYVITAAEGGALHLARLRERARDFDPAVRDRLIAGAMIPAAHVNKAQKFRRWYREQVLALFAKVDAVLAPATPCTAPLI